MVPVKIFEHILATLSELPIRPIVLLAGDDRQLPPTDLHSYVMGKGVETITEQVCN